MRLFTAIDVSAEVRDRLTALTTELQPLARLRWSPAANLHVTTKFIGEWPADRLGEVRQALDMDCEEIRVTVAGVGFFPNDRFPRVFYARVEPSAELNALAERTDAGLQTLGIAREKHPYRPHVTLARVPEGMRLHGMMDRLEELKPGQFGCFPVNEFGLYESKGGRYVKLQSFPLQVPAR